jgi:hypothetical protein
VIFWTNPLSDLKVRCRMNIAWFPFDHHLCTLTFGSWSYTSKYLNYTCRTEEPSLKNFTDNVEWILVKYKPSRAENKYEHWIEDDYFSEIKYKFLIRRKPLFVIQNYVLSSLLLSVLTLVSFFIPFVQEMLLGISILLTFAVFKLRLNDDVPTQSDTIPLINVYYMLCMTFSLASMIWFSINYHLKERNEPLSKVTRSFILKYLCKIMFIKPNQLINSINLININIFTINNNFSKRKNIEIL